MALPPQRTPFGMRRVVVETPRGRIIGLHNAPSGASSRNCPAIMVNGLMETKERWAPTLVQLGRQGYDAYSYDHLGQFESEGIDDPECYRVDALAEDLLALLDTISPHRPVHVVGGCLGGFVAKNLARRWPHRVRSLVLLGAGSSVSTSATPLLHEQVAEIVASGGMAALFERIREEAHKAGVSERSVQRVRQGYLDTRSGFVVGFSHSAVTEPGSDALIPPVLVSHGSTDPMWSAHEQHLMAERLNAAIEVIEGAGHSPTVTHPRSTAEMLIRFWETTDSPPAGARPPEHTSPQPHLDTSPA